MKNLLLVFMLIIGSNLYGQTDSIERAALDKRFLSKSLSQDEFAEIVSKWVQTINVIKKYPDLPLDQSGQVHYVFLNEFKNMTKEKLFNRTLEWLTIKYGVIPAYLYSNLEDGKIILKNSMNTTGTTTCNYTYIITIKNEKILIEFMNIGYQTFYEGHYSNDFWIADKTISFDPNKVYPISSKKPSEWVSNLNLLKTTNENFDAEIANLSDYILNYDTSYTF
jgi:hypothetical protein